MESIAAPENRLFRLLTDETRARFGRVLEPVELDRSDVLFRAHEALTDVYFPTTAVVSLVASLESGETLEVGIVGRDGAVGIAVCPGVTTMTCDAVVQVPGAAHRVTASWLRRELEVNRDTSAVFGRYAELLYVRALQLCACNMFHSVEQRCARWLLTVNDLIDHDGIPLTHELLSTMLGVHRSTVTVVLGSLQRSGLVRDERGRVVILSRAGLETASCECYRVMREQQHRLLGF